ncbi:MAG: hypothetical protein ACE5GE_11355, partial [Phycisphaerae bacterium]
TPATRLSQLFNIAQDPYEQNNLLDRYPQQSRQLLQTIQEIVDLNQSIAAGFTPESADLTPQQLQRLNSIGYLGGN